MAETKPSPGIVGLITLGIRTLFAVLFRLLSAPLRWSRWDGPPTLLQDVVYCAIRTTLAHATIPQLQYAYLGTTEAYHEWCKDARQEPKTIALENVIAHWIGEEEEDADVIILFLHGGGYILPCSQSQLKYLHRLVKDMNTRKDIGHTVSVLLPAYSLTTEAHYPTQLIQAMTVLSYLLTDRKRSPSSIMIAGESAGGNLVLSVLSHILHPQQGSDVPQVALKTPLRGAFLCSPWVSFDTNYNSNSTNANKDILIEKVLLKWGSMYVGGSKDQILVNEDKCGDGYIEPLQNGPDWWQGMNKVVKSVLVWAGEDEVLLDSIREFEGKFREGWTSGGGHNTLFKTIYGKGEAHCEPIVGDRLGRYKKGKSQLQIEDWLKKHLA